MMINMQQQFGQFYQAGLTATVNLMTAAAEGAIRVRTRQLEAATQMLSENAAMGQRIRETGNVSDLLALNAELVGAQIKGMASYWSGIGDALRQTQLALHDRAQEQLADVERQLTRSLDAAGNGAPEPVVEVMKAMTRATLAGLGTAAHYDSSQPRETPIVPAEAAVRQAPANLPRAA